jgi:preprotein translocase SecF subunit
MDLIRKTNIDFVSSRGRLFIITAVMAVVGLVACFVVGIDYGIDFTGGTQITVRFSKKTVGAEQIRFALGQMGYGGAELKSFGSDGEYLIRVGSQANPVQVSQRIVSSLRTSFPNDDVKLLGADNVAKKVSGDLAINSVIALLVAAVVIMIFVALRFEFSYGLSSIVALLHDVILAFVISVLFNKTGLLNLELSLNSIAAYLTILGYSINDKVVVFDRIRENREKHKGMSLSDLINLSINETLSRTIITGISVLAALLVLVFFGGDVLEGFAFTMFVGIVVGTYSSIYIASSFILWFTDRVRHKNIGQLHTANVKG